MESTDFSEFFKCNYKLWFNRIRKDLNKSKQWCDLLKRGNYGGQNREKGQKAGDKVASTDIHTSIQNKDQETIMKVL